jgi:hypothetical protein
LFSRSQGGKPVWAGSFIRRRRMVLDHELLTNEAALRGILIHELFHFVWVRAGNPARRSFALLLEAEAVAHARGELGESAEAQKDSWSAGSRQNHSRAWSEYVCESFCDTAAWVLCSRTPWPVSLGESWRAKRRRWFRDWIGGQANGVRI